MRRIAPHINQACALLLACFFRFISSSSQEKASAPIQFEFKSLPFHLQSDESQARNAPETMAVGVAVFDYNGDGRPDIVTANALSNDATLLRNTTTPGATTVTFATAQPFGTGVVPGSIAAADLNGDGKPDLIVANTDIGVSGNNVSVLLNSQYLPMVVTSPATGTIVHDYLFADGFE